MVTKIVEIFLKSKKCATDVLYRLGKIDFKELDEVLNMLKFYEMSEAYSLKNTIVIDVGSGKRPTLGILYAFNYASNKVISIDPNIAEKDYQTRNFTYKKMKLEDWDAKEIADKEEIILFANHSHHSLNEVYDLFNKCQELNTIHYFVNPCCVDNVPKGIILASYIPQKSVSTKNHYYYAKLIRKEI